MTPEERFQENYKLIFWYLRKHRYGKHSDEDYQQQAALALWKACLMYDESKGVKFSTYAVPLMHSSVRALENSLYRCSRVESYSLDEDAYLSSDDYCTHLDLVADKEASFESNVVCMTDVETVLNGMVSGTRQVIEKLMAGYSQSDIAEELGVSRQRVSQRIKRFKDEYQKYMSV